MKKLFVLFVLPLVATIMVTFCSAAFALDWPAKTDVPTDKVWTIKFNQPIDEGTVQSVSITNDSQQKIETTNKLAEADSITVKAIQNYIPGNRYYLNIVDVMSASGKALTEPVVMPFIIKVDPIKRFSGTGSDYTGKFQLDGGLVVVKSTYTGDSNFIVHLLDEKGETVKYLVNEIGNYTGEQALNVGPGTYLLDITAKGNWTIELRQPVPSVELNAPVTMEGSGSAVSKFIYLDKNLTYFDMSHNGDSNFIVTLLDKDGNYAGLLANEIGKYEGKKAEGIRDAGIYLLNVQADGNWAIKITQ